MKFIVFILVLLRKTEDFHYGYGYILEAPHSTCAYLFYSSSGMIECVRIYLKGLHRGTPLPAGHATKKVFQRDPSHPTGIRNTHLALNYLTMRSAGIAIQSVAVGDWPSTVAATYR